KGFEYKPIDETITLTPGKMSLRFTVERWCDMRKEGWYSGDTRVHFLSPDAALLEGQAEDVAVVNLLAAHTTIEVMGPLPDQSLDQARALSARAQELGRLPLEGTLSTEQEKEQRALELAGEWKSILKVNRRAHVPAIPNI